MNISICKFLHVHFHMHISTCTFLNVHFHMHISTCTFLHVHFYMYISTCTFLHVHFYMYISTWTSKYQIGTGILAIRCNKHFSFSCSQGPVHIRVHKSPLHSGST